MNIQFKAVHILSEKKEKKKGFEKIYAQYCVNHAFGMLNPSLQ